MEKARYKNFLLKLLLYSGIVGAVLIFRLLRQGSYHPGNNSEKVDSTHIQIQPVEKKPLPPPDLQDSTNRSVPRL